MRRNWRDEARQAIAELEGVGHGSREIEMRIIARQLSGHTDATALRRAIAAHGFLERLRSSDPAAHAHLENAPLSIVEVIARWFSFDSAGALGAAAEWASGIGNVRSIAKKMLASRPPGYAGKSGAMLERAYAAVAKPFVAEAVGGLVGSDIRMTATSVRDVATSQTLDFVFEVGEGRRVLRVATFVVGPYVNEKLYLSRGGDWVARAFALAWTFDRVVIALPFEKALWDYRRRIAAMHRDIEQGAGGAVRAPPVVDVVHIDVPKTSAEEDEALERLAFRD